MVPITLSLGVLQPEDLGIVQAVYDRVSGEPWFPVDPQVQSAFARFVIQTYISGDITSQELEAICYDAAQARFAKGAAPKMPLKGCHVLVVEDEYLVAREAADRLETLGAVVIGPVGNVADALDLIETVEPIIDAALLDINLGGQMVYPVAAFLKMKQVPFAFVTGYDGRVVPPSYRAAPTFSKPSDWGAIAQQLFSNIGAASVR